MRTGNRHASQGPETGKIRAALFRSSENLFALTVLVIGVGVVLLGGALTYVLRIPIESAMLEEAVRDIETTVRPFVLKKLSPEDLAQPMTGARYEEVAQMFRESMLPHNVVRLKLWDLAGRVVYSTLPSEIGSSYPDDEHLRQAIQGQHVWEVTDQPEAPEMRALGQLIEVYIPLTWEVDGMPAGVLEVYLPYAPYHRQLASIRNAIFLAAVIASLTLPLALYLLYRTGWKAIREERNMTIQRQREVDALNRLLQRDIAHYAELQQRILRLRDEVVGPVPSQGNAPPLARDAWLAMRIRDLAEFAPDVMISPAQEEPKGEA
ncbi:MAG: hypothetical protein Q7K03_06240 [Dehalococcoidia bacterium]|nr:hypothetical protein [Dehalococcoidia bacterium]